MFQWLHMLRTRLKLNNINRVLKHNYHVLSDAISELHKSTDEKKNWEIIFNTIQPCVSTVSEYFEMYESDVWCDTVMWNELAIRINSCQSHSTMSHKSHDNQESLEYIIGRLDYLQKYSAHYITSDAYLERPFV